MLYILMGANIIFLEVIFYHIANFVFGQIRNFLPR